MNEIKIIKKEYLDTLNHHYFQFMFEGIPKEGVNEEKIDSMLDKWISDSMHHNMAKNVRTLRTRLKDYQEKRFSLYFKSEKEEETIGYKNGKLFYVQVIQKDGKNILNAEYVKGGTFSFSCTDLEKEKVFSEKSNIDMVEKMKKIQKYIASLNTISKVELNGRAKRMIQLYQLFYNENPDFSIHNTNEKIQNMFIILSAFDITDLGPYSFSMEDGHPISSRLSHLINDLCPYGEVEKVDNPVPLQNDVIEKTKIIGQCVTDFINKHENPMECLTNITRIIFYNYWDLIDRDKRESLILTTKLNEDEINDIFTLGRRITKDIEKN